MPDFKATVFYTVTKEVTVKAQGHKSAAKKALKAAEAVEANSQELDGVEATDGMEARYFTSWGSDGQLELEED